MSTQQGQAPYYFVPGPSKWPVLMGAALLVTMAGASAWVNGIGWGKSVNIAGIIAALVVLYYWFGDAIAESEGGMYNARIDTSYRWSMSWFIFSEVMFFAAFFGALFYARHLSVPWAGGEGVKIFNNLLLWQGAYDAGWPTNGPQALGPRDDGSFETIPAFGLPAINTAILLLSGVTLTIAHHALQEGNRRILNIFLAATFLLGFIFLGVQIYEYAHAYNDLGLQLSTGIYGSTFFMLTGFHGLHVTLGAIMLLVIWFRTMKGHFTPQRHFGFEAVAWYWHFVDVVWLGLFVFVYWV